MTSRPSAAALILALLGFALPVRSQDAKGAIDDALGRGGGVATTQSGKLQISLTDSVDDGLVAFPSIDAEYLAEVTELVIFEDVESAKSWVHLRKLPKLRIILLIPPAKWSREFGTEIGKLRELEGLFVDKVAVNDEAIRQISKCGRLTALSMRSSDLSKCDPSPLGELKELRQLVLSETGLSSNQLKFVAKLPKIGWLTLNHTRVDGKIVDTLRDCDSLEMLDLKGTLVGEKDVQRLETALPRCSILSGPE